MLKEEYEGQLEPDEAESNTHVIEDDDDLDYDSGKEYIRESAASPSVPNAEGGNQTKDKSNTTDPANAVQDQDEGKPYAVGCSCEGNYSDSELRKVALHYDFAFCDATFIRRATTPQFRIKRYERTIGGNFKGSLSGALFVNIVRTSRWQSE